jgi:hypothetical protein
MPRDGSGVYSKPSGTEAAPNATITSSQFNVTVDDLVTDANTARPITAGGTGAATAALARGNLDVARVVTSETDVTAGRGLIVGSGGLLANAPAIAVTNLNDVVTGHNWAVNNAAGIANLPTSAGPGIVTVERRATDRYWQTYREAAPSGGSNGREWTRVYNGSFWTSWAPTYSPLSILGDVSQSGGVPTGALIQTASGSNGLAKRFACGLQICWHRVALTVGIGSSHLGGFRSGTQTWTFPLAFQGDSQITATGSPDLLDDAGGVICGGITTTKTDWAFTAVGSQSSALRAARLMAVGRWF